MNLTLRSGTNQFHGSAYYFNREFFGAKSRFRIKAEGEEL